MIIKTVLKVKYIEGVFYYSSSEISDVIQFQSRLNFCRNGTSWAHGEQTDTPHGK